MDVSIASAPASATLTLPAAPQIATPANNATGVTSTERLSWSSFGTGGVYELYVNGTNSRLCIFTPNLSVSLAKLAKAEIGFAPASSYSWDIGVSSTGVSTFGTLDPGPAVTTFYEGESATFKFTTQ